MEKFRKDKNKIKRLKIRRGIPLFINFCYNQRIRHKLSNSKLFIEKDELHYHLKWYSDYDFQFPSKETVQYIIKNITNYTIDTNNIIIEGKIEKTKN